MITQKSPLTHRSRLGLKGLRVPLLIALLWSVPALAEQPEAITGQTVAADLRGTETPRNLATTTSLADLGFERGWTFEGLDSNHLRTFHFPLPRLNNIQGAVFRIGYNATDGLNPLSNLRVEIDGRPLRSRSLAEGGKHWLEVPVPADLLTRNRRSFVELTLRTSMLMSEDRCMDERASANFLHIDPTSGLVLTSSGGENSPAGLWENLPRAVTLSLPAEADQGAFASALALTRQLAHTGHQVSIVRLPNLGDIVIAPAIEVDTLVADLPGGPQALERAESSANARALVLPQQRILALSPQTNEWPAGLAEAGWMPLARGNGVHVTEATDFTVRPLSASTTEASFAQLGAETDVRDVVRNAEWSIPLGPQRAPAGRIPTQIRLAVTSAPVSNDFPMMLYAYADDVLQGVHRLQGGTEQVTLHLAANAMRHTPNELRIAVRRVPDNGDCRALPTGYPVQLSPASSVVFGRTIDAPRDFGDLAHHFAAGTDLVVSPAVASHAETTLPFISRLLDVNRYPAVGGRVIIADSLPASDRPFILISEKPDALSGQTIRFDRGRIEVRNSDGDTVLDLGASHALTVAQLAEHDSRSGLWVKAPASGALPDTPKEALALTFDKAAFIDDRGIALSLPAEQSDFAALDYPEHRNWFDIFGAYRYWFMALGWLLIAGILAHLYIKARSHKGTR